MIGLKITTKEISNIYKKLAKENKEIGKYFLLFCGIKLAITLFKQITENPKEWKKITNQK